jgi:hypothetical protein
MKMSPIEDGVDRLLRAQLPGLTASERSPMRLLAVLALAALIAGCCSLRHAGDPTTICISGKPHHVCQPGCSPDDEPMPVPGTCVGCPAANGGK